MKKYYFFVIIGLAAGMVSFTHKAKRVLPFQNNAAFGYTDKGDSVEFVFGQQKTIKIGMVTADLDKRRAEIKQVSVAGDFNNWKPGIAAYILKKTDAVLYKLVVSKATIGKKGESRQFKFVLNGKYWIEPPAEATNKITGKDGNTNLFLRL